jgi:hypothetical protein
LSSPGWAGRSSTLVPRRSQSLVAPRRGARSLPMISRTEEGRSPIDAVLVALMVGGLLLVGANSFDAAKADGELGSHSPSPST